MIVLDDIGEPLILTVLGNSNFDFYLGGSRYMHKKAPQMFPIKSDTDWDFYTTASDAVARFLLANGFISSQDSVYFDTECLGIFKHKDNVQVVLRKNATFYKNVVAGISPEYYYADLWKSAPKMTPESRLLIGARFNQLFATAHQFE